MFWQRLKNIFLKNDGQYKKLIVLTIIAIVVFAILLVFSYQHYKESVRINTTTSTSDSDHNSSALVQDDNISNGEDNKMNTLATLKDNVENNSIWCGTFQLVWNDMLENMVKNPDKDFSPYTDLIKNLNLKTFTKKSLSDDSYYINRGNMTEDFKAEIEKDIKEKFDSESKILDSFDWNPENYLFYAMLKKNYTFEYKFDVLENSSFNDTENVKYFGFTGNSASHELLNQINVLYYKDSDKYAISIDTTEGDQIIFARGIEKSTFDDMYSKLTSLTDKKVDQLTKQDSLMIPNLNISIMKEYTDLEKGITVKTKDDSFIIGKCLQAIDFNLDNEGGSLTSEAGMSLIKGAILEETEARQFNFNTDFVMFIKESDSTVPYFAAYINDISNFQ